MCLSCLDGSNLLGVQLMTALTTPIYLLCSTDPPPRPTPDLPPITSDVFYSVVANHDCVGDPAYGNQRGVVVVRQLIRQRIRLQQKLH